MWGIRDIDPDENAEVRRISCTYARRNKLPVMTCAITKFRISCSSVRIRYSETVETSNLQTINIDVVTSRIGQVETGKWNGKLKAETEKLETENGR